MRKRKRQTFPTQKLLVYGYPVDLPFSSPYLPYYTGYWLTFVFSIDSLTSSLVPVKPWDDSLNVRSTVEVEEFSQSCPEAAHPHISYVNNFYVYPLALNYSNQKVYSKVKCQLNISVQTDPGHACLVFSSRFRFWFQVHNSYCNSPCYLSSSGKKHFCEDWIQRFWWWKCQTPQGISNCLRDLQLSFEVSVRQIFFPISDNVGYINKKIVFVQCIYKKKGSPGFTTHAFAAVVHHCTTPTFYEEVSARIILHHSLWRGVRFSTVPGDLTGP